MNPTQTLKNRRSAVRRSVAVLGTAALCLGVMALSPIGQATASGGHASVAASSDKKPGKPAKPAPAPEPAPGCTLTDPDSPNNEFAMCVVADVELGAPDADGNATATLTVTSQEDVSDAVVSVSLNQNLSMVSAPGFGNLQSSPSGIGPVSTLSQTVNITAGATRTFSFAVHAASKGYATIQAKVKTGNPRTSASDESTVLVGGASAASPTGGLAVVEAPANAVQAPASSPAEYRPAKVEGPKPKSPDAPGASCATGRWVFQNELGQTTGSMNYQIQAFDQDPGQADDLLATSVTGSNGNYTICFESTDFDQGGGQEVYLRWTSSNSAWRVRDTAAGNNNYVFGTGVIAIADPGTANFGTLQPADPALHRALHAFDGINLLWLWQPNGCLDDAGQCRQMIVNWTPTSTDGTYYSLGSKDVHLAAANPDADHITIHEGGHALMDAIYEDDYPPFPNCNPHFIFGNSSTGCAWTEGWAEWVPARVLVDPFFRWDDGNELNLETPTWNDGNPHGDQAEGRVAGALIDLSDNNNEGFWDRYGEAEAYGAQFEEIYMTSLGSVSDTLNEYFTVDRPIGQAGFLARTAVFQNTNDYAARPQRDPLTNGGQLTRPSLSLTPSPHNSSFSTPSNFWSGVAIRGTNDNDLRLFDDEALTTNLASSTFGSSTIDYVLVDSNSGRRAVGDSYFPQAFLFSGSGGYNVELSANSITVPLGISSASFAAGDVIDVRDVFLTTGVQEFFRVVPAAGLNVGVNLHESTATASTWVQGRPSYKIFADSAGAGGVEAFNYTPTSSSWHALVLTNTGGSGGATIYRDTTAPTGSSVVINGGDANTTSQNVNLALSATDANTGVMDMRISVDGVLDSEAFEPYATSKAVTLPAGVGAKTVIVQFRNNAGMAAAAVSDTINLIAVPGAPTVTSSTPSAGAVTVAFSPPASDGGSPITSYNAQCVSTDGGVNKDQDRARPARSKVTGLTGGKNYHCRVRATNAVGHRRLRCLRRHGAGPGADGAGVRRR